MANSKRQVNPSRALPSSAVVRAVAQWAEHLEIALDPARVAEGMLPVLAETSGATRASLMLVNPRTGRLRLVAGLGLPRQQGSDDLPIARRRISDWVLRERQSLIMNGEVRDQRFDASAPRDRIASAMSVPLPGSRSVVGVLNLARVGTTIPFDARDLALVEAAAAALGTLFERVAELGSAREPWRSLVHRTLAPGSAPEPDAGCALSLRPGAAPSPDLFEQVKRGDGARLVMLAEPFGGPLPARLLAEWLRGAFHAIARRHGGVASLAAELDERLRDRNDGSAARAWFGCLGTSGHMISCAAGYPSPFCLPGEGTAGQRLLEGGPPLGTARAPGDYEETSLRLLPGDGLLVVSDGMLHAMSHAGRRFGEESILGHLHDHWPGPIDALAHGLTEAACAHVGLAVPPDDVLALVLRYSRSA
jgi:hypothetical protein